MHTAIHKLALALVLVSLGGCDPKSSGDTDAWRGMALIEQRKFTEAIPVLESSLEKGLGSDSRSIVLTAIGNSHNELGDSERSHEFHNKAIAADPTNHQAIVNKGVVFRLQGDYARAEECYMKALALAPDYAELHASMGALAMFQGDTDKAIRRLEKAVQLDDLLAVAHSNLAVAYSTAGRFAEADAELEKAVLHGYHQPELFREHIETLKVEP